MIYKALSLYIDVLKDSCSRYFVATVYVMLVCQGVLAQEIVSGSVLDSETDKPIPYCMVYCMSGIGTMCNGEGNFRIYANANDTVEFRNTGYVTQRIAVQDINGTVLLTLCEKQLTESKAPSADEVIKRVVTQLRKEYKKYKGKNTTYFTRTFQEIDGKTEMTELFLEGNSAVNIRDLTPLTGRRYSTKDGKPGNANASLSVLHHYFELGPMMNGSDFWREITRPLDMQSVKSAYDTHLRSINDSLHGESLYCIEFKCKKKHEGKNMMEGTLYVDGSTYKPKSFVGTLSRIDLLLSDKYGGWYGREDDSRTVATKFFVNYCHDNGYTEVESVATSTEGNGMRITSMMISVDKETLSDFEVCDASGEARASVDYRKKSSTARTMPEVIRRTSEEKILIEETELAESSRNMRETDFGAFGNVAARQAAFGKTIPQEKVYIHMDNTGYFLGDTIWFAAYTRQTTDDRPSKVSGVLYVELLNNDGYLVERKLIEMKNGRGNGFFALNKTIQYAGYYELRAYTRWQLNWGRYERRHSKVNGRDWFVNDDAEKNFYRDYEKLYSRVFPVYDTPRVAGTYDRNMTLRPMRRHYKDEPDKRRLQLSIFPEGGNLVKGAECRVAFEAAWSDGEWAEGCLVYDNDSVRTVNRGRGLFSLIPGKDSPDKVSFVSKEGARVTVNLPHADTTGVALRLSFTEKELQIRAIVSEDLCPDSLAMVVMCEGRTEEFATLTGSVSVMSFPTSSYAPGVHDVVIFDKQGRIYADRLFFVTRQNAYKPMLSVSGIKDEYGPYERIDLTLASHGAANTPLSICVQDGMQHEFIYDNANIMAEMLLCSEIRGFVPDAAWFFSSDDEEHRTALDLLMMTQGWRRFDWRDMAVRGEWDITETSERTPIIKGIVTNVPSWDYAWYSDFMEIVGLEDTRKDSLDNGRSRRPWEETLKDKSGILIHGELVGIDGKNAHVYETTPKAGKFQMELPRVYGYFSLFLSASNTTKWKKDKRYEWICPAPSGEYARDVSHREYNIRVQHPYPRYVCPYTYYQQRTNDSADTLFVSNGDGKDSGVTTMCELPVRTKRGGLKKFDDSAPAMIYDAYSAFSDAFDAGFANLYVSTDIRGQKNVARNIVNDFGVPNPHNDRLAPANPKVGGAGWFYDSKNKNNDYLPDEERKDNSVYNMTWYGEANAADMNHQSESEDDEDGTDYIKIRYGLSPTERSLKYVDVPDDSIYSPKYLSSKPVKNVIFNSNRNILYNDETFVSPGERKDFNDIGKLDKYLLYTDYCPRRSGSNRYMGNDIDVQLAVYPYYDGSRRMIYRDRQMYIDGFAYPAEFYSPDYSRYSMPDKEDYRRTLYWNPSLMLDSNGEARITLYNSSRTTSILVDAQGQCSDGTLLWTRP